MRINKERKVEPPNKGEGGKGKGPGHGAEEGSSRYVFLTKTAENEMKRRGGKKIKEYKEGKNLVLEFANDNGIFRVVVSPEGDTAVFNIRE